MFKSLVIGRWSLAGAALALLISSDAAAGVMDFKTLGEAKQAYEVGNYTKASELYGRLHGKNAQARYNYGDALYKQKKYKEAAEVFKQIDDPALKHKALHNLGNALANSGKTDEAIKAYEEALKLEEDKDTRYNLDLLKQQKKQQQQQNKKNQNNNDQKNKQQNKDQQKQNQQKNGQNKQDDQNKNAQNKQNDKKQQGNKDQKDRQDKQNDSQNKQKRDRQQQQSGQGQSSSKPNEKQQSQSAEQKEQEQQKKEQQQRQMQQAAAKAQPISDMEERKYNQMLNKRGIKTLMVPLKGKGEPKNDETTPW